MKKLIDMLFGKKSPAIRKIECPVCHKNSYELRYDEEKKDEVGYCEECGYTNYD